MRSVSELLDATFGSAQAAEAKSVLGLTARNQVKTRFVPGSGRQQIFRIIRTQENARYWDLLEEAQTKWDLDYCYCSVFEDCWRVSSKLAEPAPVEECVRDEANEFMP